MAIPSRPRAPVPKDPRHEPRWVVGVFDANENQLDVSVADVWMIQRGNLDAFRGRRRHDVDRLAIEPYRPTGFSPRWQACVWEGPEGLQEVIVAQVGWWIPGED